MGQEWTVDEDDRPGMEWNRQILDEKGNAVCFMAHSDGNDAAGDRCKALLISAAPDLLAALQLVAGDEWGSMTGSEMSDAIQKARAAIQKATEGQPPPPGAEDGQSPQVSGGR